MFSERLKELRKQNDVSQKQLSDFLKITPQAISKWETGTAQPDNNFLIELANYFHVSTDYLLGKSDIENAENPYDDDLEQVLFSKAKELTDDEKKAVLGVINAIKRDVDNGKI